MRRLLTSHVLIGIWATLFGSFHVAGQTYSTNSLLSTGVPVRTISRAPGTSGAVGLIHSVFNPSKGILLIDTNPGGVRKGEGTVSMDYSGTGSIITNVHLSGLPGAGVDGSPFALVGCDQWANCFADTRSLRFPVQLVAMSSLAVDYRYALTGDIQGSRDIDMIWDEWVCKSNHPTGIPDCLEVEILPYYNFSLGHEGATFVRTLKVSMMLNGIVEDLDFDEYSWSQAILYFPRSLPGRASASMRFDMLTFLNQAVNDFGNSSFSWLMGMEAGTEFGGNSKQSYEFTLTELKIEQRLTVGN